MRSSDYSYDRISIGAGHSSWVYYTGNHAHMHLFFQWPVRMEEGEEDYWSSSNVKKDRAKRNFFDDSVSYICTIFNPQRAKQNCSR